MSQFLENAFYSTAKRVIAAVLAVVLILPSFPLAALAQEGTQTPEEQSTENVQTEEETEKKDTEEKKDEETTQTSPADEGSTPPDEEMQEGNTIEDEQNTEKKVEKEEKREKKDDDAPWYEQEWPTDPAFPALSEFPAFSEEDFEEAPNENAEEGFMMARAFAPLSFFDRDITIEKTLINDDEGTAEVTDFSVTVLSLTLSGGFSVDEYSFDEEGLIEIDNAPLGLYHIVENEAAGYDVSYDDCSAFLVTLFGGSHTCTVTNDDAEPEAPTVPECSNEETTFDPFALGTVDGQFGWSSTGPFDQAVVENTYGFNDFGCKSLRISNAITSGSFGNQTFSYSLDDEAGDTDAENGGMSGGTRQNHYEAQFDIASTMSAEQPGLAMSVSPDRGDGARMSYLSFTDTEGGIDVVFYDVQGTANPANFVATNLGTLDRTETHTIKFIMDFVDGGSNDVVEIYIDGVLVHTGTSWENYFRYDDESNPSLIDVSRTVDSLLFRVGGTAAPATEDAGFLIDNVELESSTIDTDTPPSIPVNGAPHATVLPTNSFTFTWDASTDDGIGSITYEFQSSLDPAETDGVLTTGLWQSGSLATNSIVSSGAPDGTWYWQVRAKDEAGNYSDWSEIWSVTLATSPLQSEITQPTADEVVFGTTELAAFYADENSDGNDNVQWAIRAGTCAAGSGTVFGNVDGKNSPFTWGGALFNTSIDTTTIPDGSYCFIFNPSEDAGDTNQRLTRTFSVDNTGPTAPEIVFPSAEQIFTIQPILNDWTEATDLNGVATYEIAYGYDDGHTFGGSTCPSVTEINSTTVSGCRQTTDTQRNHTPALSEQGGVTIWVRAIDTLGNIGAWSNPMHYYYDVSGLGPTSPTSDTDTVVVTENTASAENQPGWMFNRDPLTATFYEFIDTVAGIGEGSLRIAPITNTGNGNNDKFVGELFLLQPMEEIDSVSFDFRIESPDETVEEHFYMNIYANFGVSPETKFYDCRYNVVASVGSTSDFTTVTFDPTQAYPVATRTGGEASPFTCPAIPADMDTLSPGSTIRSVAINVGDTTANDAGVGGYLDEVVVVQTTGAHTQTTIYDFEPEPVTVTSGGGGGGSNNNDDEDEEDTTTEEQDLLTEEPPVPFVAFGAGNQDEGGEEQGGADEEGEEAPQGGVVEDTSNTNLLANVLSALGLDEAASWLLALIAALILALGYGGWFAFRKWKKSNNA